MSEQGELFPEDIGGKPVDQEKVDKAKARAVENKYYEDKRIKPSPLVVNAELEKMKEILSRGKGSGGASMGGGGADLEKGMMGSKPKQKYASGGKVKSASARADGCCIRGKTRA